MVKPGEIYLNGGAKRVYLVYTPKRNTPNLEHVSEDQICEMSTCLVSRGYDVVSIDFEPGITVQRIAAMETGVVFNLAYGWRGDAPNLILSQPEVTAELERTGHRILGCLLYTSPSPRD